MSVMSLLSVFLVSDSTVEERGTGDTCCDETYWNPVVGLLIATASKTFSRVDVLAYYPTNRAILNSTTAAVLV